MEVDQNEVTRDQLLAIVRHNKFSTRDMNECLNINSRSQNKATKLERIEAKIRSNDWRNFRIVVLEILNRKHPLGLDNERAFEFGERITNELVENGIDAEYDENGSVKPPPQNNHFLFAKKFSEACNGNTGGAVQSAKLIGHVWREIGSENQELWKLAHQELVEVYQDYLRKGGEQASVTVKKLQGNRKPIQKNRTCPYCLYSGSLGNVYTHLRKHFPTHKKDSKVAKKFDEIIEKVSKNDDYTDQMHQDFVEFWRVLCSGNKTTKQKQFIAKLKSLFDVLMSGNKDKLFYLLTQLVEDIDSFPDVDIPSLIFRYVGKTGKGIRHFESVGIANGNISREIKKIIESYLTRDKSTEIPLNSRLYGWKSLKVPDKSLETTEHVLMMALWQLSERRSSVWNQYTSTIPKDGKLYGHDPEKLVYLGLFILHSLIEPLRDQIKNNSFFSSQEILTIYEGFDKNQKASFNVRYKVDNGTDAKDDRILVLENLLVDALDSMKLNAGLKQKSLEEHKRLISLMEDLGIENEKLNKEAEKDAEYL